MHEPQHPKHEWLSKVQYAPKNHKRYEDYSNPGNGVVLLLQTEERKIIVNIEILQGTIFKLSHTKVLVTLFMN